MKNLNYSMLGFVGRWFTVRCIVRKSLKER